MSCCEHLTNFVFNEVKYGTKVYKDEWFVHFKIIILISLYLFIFIIFN